MFWKKKKVKEKKYRYLVVAGQIQRFFEKEDEVIDYIVKNDLRKTAKVYQEKNWGISLIGSYFE